MQLSDIRTRLTDVYGNTLTSESTFYNRVINDAYVKLCAMTDWWWLEDYCVLRFNAPMVTEHDFTCTVTSSVISASGTAMLGAEYLYGWISVGSHCYRITGVTTAASTMTLDALFMDPTTVYSCTFWNDTLTLPTAFDHVVSLAPRRDPNYRPLRQISLEEIEKRGPNLEGSECECGEAYAIYRETSFTKTAARIRIYPPPDSTAEYAMRYIQCASVLSADSDVPLLPPKFHSVLVDLSRLELMKVTGANPDEISAWEGETSKGLMQIMKEQMRKGNVLRQFGRFGTQKQVSLPFKMTNYTLGTDSD